MAAPSPQAGNWSAAWSAALDALEMDVAAVEEMLAGDHRDRDLQSSDAWSPPEDIGPLPLDLRPRADAILARQLAAAQALAMAMVGNRRQAAMLARVESGNDGGNRPVYVNYAA
ncbi:hypothetical protein GCM10010156_76690 [Planobispora rosea]|uniref:Uncharacterized protein n=1 Tax=Planobispora rosea TaxID=35762 RepID=A0A8J3S6J3_PLARO|nr:hypothetical protein [Planobispora rosea]GGT08341.1 hypothetical protein GCM10010156_76690 [Planobispora rosea]GIH89231.1 hypothetical protein Pro02_76390 [Planobispora rosea]